MSTMLKFHHMGWDIVTAAWSAGRKDDARTFVCYGWSTDQGFWRVTFDLPFDLFLDRVARGGIVDLGPVR